MDGALVSGNTARSNGRAGTSPYDVTVAYALNDDYELALRYEDFDDADGTDIIRTGVTRYLDGHGLKWQVDWASTDSRSVFGGSDAITVGLTLAW